MGSFDPTFGPTSSYPLSEANLPHPMIDQVDHWRKPKLWFESFEFDVYTQQTENEIKSEDKESTFFNHNSAIRQHTITNWRFNFVKWWSSLMIDLAHCRHAVHAVRCASDARMDSEWTPYVVEPYVVETIAVAPIALTPNDSEVTPNHSDWIQ